MSRTRKNKPQTPPERKTGGNTERGTQDLRQTCVLTLMGSRLLGQHKRIVRKVEGGHTLGKTSSKASETHNNGERERALLDKWWVKTPKRQQKLEGGQMKQREEVRPAVG